MDGNLVLIKIIKKNPTIWMHNYKNKHGELNRCHFWKEISKTIGADVNWIISRWKTLYNSFIKNYKIFITQKGDCKINFKYFNEMKFLVKTLHKKKEPHFKIGGIDYDQAVGDLKSNMEFVLNETNFNKTNVNYFQYEQTNNQISNVSNSPDKHIYRICSKKSSNLDNSDKYMQASSLTNPRKNRCEDSIFGELVTAMLKEIHGEKKKNIKKQIMNMLLS